jgi:hypothetical protein
VTVDAVVLLFAVALSLLSAAAVSLAPAWFSARVDLAETLKESGRSVSGGHRRVRSALVVAEIAISMLLLAGAGLLARSLWTVLRAERGFQTSGILTLRVPLPAYRYPESHHRREFFRRFLEGVRSLPEVESAGLTAKIPLSGENDINTVHMGDFDLSGNLFAVGVSEADPRIRVDAMRKLVFVKPNVRERARRVDLSERFRGRSRRCQLGRIVIG